MKNIKRSTRNSTGIKPELENQIERNTTLNRVEQE